MRRGTKRWILWAGRLVTLLVYLVFLAYAVIVGIAFVLQLLGANPTSDFADWIYRAAANITEPFRGIFPTTQISDRSQFNASWLFALIVYLVIAVVLHGIIDWLTRKISGIDRAEERERQQAALDAQLESTRAALGLNEPAAVPVAVPPAVPTTPVPVTGTVPPSATVVPSTPSPSWVQPTGEAAPPPPSGEPAPPL